MTRKKLQVFVSSTFTDLIAERQAAVEAILAAGHIPAGMELFNAGDQSQMEVIKKWIAESDVYLLILGGRYGSVEATSGKSYTHLEYEYAVSLGKPHFAIVISEEHLERKAKLQGLAVTERVEGKKLEEFRKQIHSKMIRPWNDLKDIENAILRKLPEYAHRSDLNGWVPGNEGVNGAAIAEEMARLTKENAKLRAEASELRFNNGLTYKEIYKLLNGERFPDVMSNTVRGHTIEKVAEASPELFPSALHAFWAFQNYFHDGFNPGTGPVSQRISNVLRKISLVQWSTTGLQLTVDGQKFLLRMRVELGRELPSPIEYSLGDNLDPFFD